MAVEIGVRVGVAVSVGVGVWVGLIVAVAVGVFVAVAVVVSVGVEVWVGVFVAVLVGVLEGVGVTASDPLMSNRMTAEPVLSWIPLVLVAQAKMRDSTEPPWSASMFTGIPSVLLMIRFKTKFPVAAL